MWKRIIFILMLLFMVFPQCFPQITALADNDVVMPPGRYVLNKTLAINTGMENVTGDIVWWNNTYYIIIGSRDQIMIYEPLQNKTVFLMRTGGMLNYTFGFNQTMLALLIIEYRLVNNTYTATPYYWINSTMYRGPALRLPVDYRLSQGFRTTNDTISFYMYRIDLTNDNFSSIIVKWNIRNNNVEIINDDETAYTAVNAPVILVSRTNRSGVVGPGTSLTIAIHKDEIRSRFTARISLSYNEYVLGVTLTNIIPTRALLVDHGNRVLGLIFGRTYSFLGRPENIVYAYLMGIYRELYVKRFNLSSDIAVSLNKLVVVDPAGRLNIYDVLTGECWRNIRSSFTSTLFILPDINGDGGQEVLLTSNHTAIVLSLASLFKWRINTSLDGLEIIGVIPAGGNCLIAGVFGGTIYIYSIKYYGPHDDSPPALSVYLQSNNGVSRALVLKIEAIDKESGIVMVVIRISGAGVGKTFTYSFPAKHIANIGLEYDLPNGRYEVVIISMNLVGLNTTVEKQIIIDHYPPRSTLL